MIEFSCPGCGKTFSVPDDFAGRRGTCRGCGHPLQAPWLGEINLTPVDDADETSDFDPVAEAQELFPNTAGPNFVSTPFLLSHDSGYAPWLAVIGTLGVLIMGAAFGMLIGSAFDLTYLAGAGGAFLAAGCFWLIRVTGLRFGRRGR